MDFINDAIVSMDAFVTAYKPAAVYFSCPVELRYIFTTRIVNIIFFFKRVKIMNILYHRPMVYVWGWFEFSQCRVLMESTIS